MSKLPNVTDLLATRSSLLELKLQIVAYQIQCILRKYNPNQPRVPRGRPEGGQWTDGSAGADRTQVAGKYDPARSELCEAQLALDEDLCRMSASPLCWSSAMNRFAACMKNNFVPKLIH